MELDKDFILASEKLHTHESFWDIDLKEYASATHGDFVLFIEKQEDGSLEYTYKIWNGNKFPHISAYDYGIHEAVWHDGKDFFRMKIEQARIDKNADDYKYMCILVRKGTMYDAEREKDIPTITRIRTINLSKETPLNQISANMAQIIESQLWTPESMQAIQECVARTLEANPWWNISRRRNP